MRTFPSISFSRYFSALGLLGVCLAAFAWASVPVPKARAQAKEVFEGMEGLERLLPTFYLYTDGEGHYLAMSVVLNPVADMKKHNGHYPRHMFWGDGASFFELRSFTGEGYYKEPGKLSEEPGAYPDAALHFDVVFWEPRIWLAGKQWAHRIIRPKEGALYVECGERKVALTPVPAEAAKAILEKAQFYKPRFQRKMHLLARDSSGVYYYIDKSAKEGEKDFRIFIGKSGQMKRVKLKNIVQDTEGEIFSTPNGNLRMVVGRSEVVWIFGKKKQTLLPVPINTDAASFGVIYDSNMQLLFNELGVYSKQKLGTPCDDI